MRQEDSTRRAVFRTERVFNVNGEWLVATREFGNLGPFPTRKEADQALGRFLSTCQPKKAPSLAERLGRLQPVDFVTAEPDGRRPPPRRELSARS